MQWEWQRPAATHLRHPLLLRGEEEVEFLAVVVHAEEEDAPSVSLDNTAGKGREGGRVRVGCGQRGEGMRKRVSAGEEERRGQGGGRGEGEGPVCGMWVERGVCMYECG